MLEVRLLGKFEVRIDGQPVEIPLRAAQSLLAYLILNAGTPYRREQLAGLFWPDMSDANARHNLRQILSRLRKAIGAQYLVADDLTITFDATTDYWLDAQVLTRKVETKTSAEELIEAVSVYNGELLPGFYDEWVLLERERGQAAFEHKMTVLLDQLIEAKRWDEVLQWGEQWITLGHSPEAAYRALIVAHGARSDASQAAAAYQRCEEALRRDLGVEPSAQTRAALERAKREATSAIDHLVQRPRTNLPAALSSFIGREKEIAEIRRLITTQRAMTLTGSGGAGKTRLAIESAAGLVDHFADGVWLIEFAPLSDAALVPHAVASTLGLVTTSGRPIVTALIDVLREKHRLLIFDNCEHLIEACAQLAAALLQACPQLHILATSRESLVIQGEMQFRVPPLSTPDPQRLPIIQELEYCEAIQLFVERGAAAVSAYTMTADNAAAIARICQRLDGMPLAIELAAARLKTLHAEEIAARLDDRFHLLTGGSRAALPRQKTLRATIEWSYNLLSAPEQALLQRLSVFAGGWTLEAAETVGADLVVGADLRVGPGADTRISPYDVVDVLTHLADKSLVNVDRTQGEETRYRMLETIRQYAREKLIESGEEAALRQRHLDYYLQLADCAKVELRRAEQFSWFQRLETDLDNIRIALEWSLTTDARLGLQIMNALRWFWYNGDHVEDASLWLARLLQQPSAQPGMAGIIRAEALAGQSLLLTLLDQLPLAQQLAEESLTLCQKLGDENVASLSLQALGRALMFQGNSKQAQQCHEHSLALSREQNNHIGVAEGLWRLALSEQNRLRRAELLAEAQEAFRAHGDSMGRVHTLMELSGTAVHQGDFQLAQRWLDEGKNLLRSSAKSAHMRGVLTFNAGRIALWSGNYDQGRAQLEESVRSSWDTGFTMWYFLGVAFLGYAAFRQNKPESARAHWEKSLRHFHEANYSILAMFTLEGFASLAVHQQQLERATRLFGWADATREAIGDIRPPSEQTWVDRDLAVIHAQLDEAAFEAEQAIGRAMTMDEAIEYALSEV
jgi:predicted ATPase/DNA-binding SARP family transcriptional activator/predicted negative regulator of RcsB-dependent stress response